MSNGTRASSSTSAAPAKDKTPPEPRPSASIILLSRTNQVLLLRRVKTSTSFASAHVFPGGNLSEFHDGPVPPPGDAKRHVDSLAYRLGAIRETFEESGILLARKGGKGGPLLNLPTAERDEARKAIYENKISFTAWLESVGGVPDTDNLIPFTRWLTPPGPPKRFTTQMYVYMLPLASLAADPVLSAAQAEALVPTPDGGAEITSAHFDDVAVWLARQRSREVTLFPPQYFLLHLLSRFLVGPPSGEGSKSRSRGEGTGEGEGEGEGETEGEGKEVSHYGAQRANLRTFLDTVPTATQPKAANHPTSRIAWADKVISPVTLGLRRAGGDGDKRAILALDKPGLELRDTGRGGDWERVVLVRFGRDGPSEAEVRGREEVLGEERAVREREEKEREKGEGSSKL